MNKLDIQLYDGQITPHFNINEFKCKANGEMLLNAQVIDHIRRLEKMRIWYNRPMIVNSGYRTLEYNLKIGSSSKSKHILGIATDIALPLSEFSAFSKRRKEQFFQNIKNKWMELCEEDGLGGGVGFYDSFFHLDSRKVAAFWDERKKR